MMIPFDIHISSTLGLLLGVSLAAGLVAEFFHLPKVTAYLAVGIVLGPGLLDMIHREHVVSFDPMLKLAMALVLFNLGCHFVIGRLRRIAARGILISLGELLATFFITITGLLLYGAEMEISLLLGCLALATAPATTILVLKEYQSSGPVTEYTGFLVALNNLAAIVAFELLLLAIPLLSGDLSLPIQASVGVLLKSIGGSVAFGIVGGLVVSYGCGLLSPGRWLVLLVASTTFFLGVCESLDIPYMLTFLVMGVTVANTSDMSEKIVEELDKLTGLLCVLFFAIHGAELDIGKFVTLGTIGIVYVICRTLGKYVGVYFASRATRQPREVTHWLGTCLIAQAGAAIGLSTIAVNRGVEWGEQIQTIILGSVVIFEIAGPLLIRFSLLRSGEIPISQAIHHTSRTPLTQFAALFARLMAALRSAPSNEPLPSKELLIEKMIVKVEPIRQSARFAEVISHIEHSHDNTYPIVDEQLRLVGVIRYSLLANVMFDQAVAGLVRAEDLATPIDALLHEDDTVMRAFELFHVESGDCIPVVGRDEAATFLGIVRRSDVMRLLIRRHRNLS